MTTPPNLPAGLREAVLNELLRSPSGKVNRASIPDTFIKSKELECDRILTALSPFVPGQSAEWARDLATDLLRYNYHTEALRRDGTYEKELEAHLAIILKHAPRTDGDGERPITADVMTLAHYAVYGCGPIHPTRASERKIQDVAGRINAHVQAVSGDAIALLRQYAEGGAEDAITFIRALDSAMLAPTQPDSNKERT